MLLPVVKINVILMLLHFPHFKELCVLFNLNRPIRVKKSKKKLCRNNWFLWVSPSFLPSVLVENSGSGY